MFNPCKLRFCGKEKNAEARAGFNTLGNTAGSPGLCEKFSFNAGKPRWSTTAGSDVATRHFPTGARPKENKSLCACGFKNPGGPSIKAGNWIYAYGVLDSSLALIE
jgi:hypothetical protein